MRLSYLRPLNFVVCLFLLISCAETPHYAPVNNANKAYTPLNSYSHEKQGKQQQTPVTAKSISPIKSEAKSELSYKDLSPAPKPSKLTKPSEQLGESTKKIMQQVELKGIIPSNQKPGTLDEHQAIASQQKQVHPIAKISVDNDNLSKSKNVIATHEAPNKAIKLKKELTTTEKTRTPENTQAEKSKVDYKKSVVTTENKKMLKLSYDWPLQGKVTRTFSQTENKGIDIVGKVGQPVKSAETGKTVYCGKGIAGYGNLVIIKHNETYLSAYANNSQLFVKEGDNVVKGQRIGQIGITGIKKATLHFEIRKNGKPINPLLFLPKR